MPFAPIRATGRFMKLHNPESSIWPGGLELLNTNITLWRELTDDAFEKNFRQRYFGNESISRQQAIERLVGMREDLRQSVSTNGLEALAGKERGLAPTEASQALSSTPVAFAELHLAMLPARRFPWGSLLLSILSHGLILWVLLSIRLPQHRNRFIDLDTEKVTYYKISEALPDVAPMKRATDLPDRLPQTTSQSAEFKARQEVRIRPEASARAELVIEQPRVRQVPTLPTLQLPNILMQVSKLNPGREPLSVSTEVARHLAMEVQHPQSLGNLPQDSAHSLPSRQPLLLLPQLAAPAEPSSSALPISQVPGEFGRLRQRSAPLPFAAPPVEDSTAGFQVEQMSAAHGPALLVYSASPAIPKGEIAVPKASSTGRLTASDAQTPLSLPAGAAEISRAEVVMPSISIRNRTVPPVAGAGTAVVQAPLPKAPELPKPPNQGMFPSLLDFLPSRLPPRRSLAASATEIGPAESPLREYESRGGPVYTAAINAPNFTSRRGSWIFRFAELWVGETSPAATTALTAPSATVKVDPKYAPEVVREKLEGVVILFAILRKDGSIDAESIRIIRKLDSRLDLSAREALQNWKFKPSQKNGVAVDIQMEVSIPFYFRSEGL